MSDEAIFTEAQRRAWVESQMLKAGVAAPGRDCTCERCQYVRHFAIQWTPLCRECGKQSCPKAKDHRDDCETARP